MKKKMKQFTIVLLVVAALVIGGAYFLPGHCRVTRSVSIQAKTKTVYPWIATLQKWPQWTAWTTDRDASADFQFTGPKEGEGAVYSWSGKTMGVGQLRITRAEPDRGVWYELELDEGRHRLQGGLTFEAQNNTTVVTWFNEENLGLNPVNRYRGLAMDALLGPDLEEGLEHLKRIIEAKK